MTSYFDLAAANERLADLRPLLVTLLDDRDTIARARTREDPAAASDGHEGVDPSSATEDLLAVVRRMEAAVRRIDGWGVTLRDIGTGLVDFPALASGRPIWLCWRLGEGDIAWWHELDAGLPGRRPLIELE